ncbi:MAG TPA: winged helix-turn-helix domain-containing protein [Amycolatopsis sp.]|nr:winged helix-turn-helix domain-containing protein [Amycolatopsis sp.]HVV10585.1 winged helix-turn-helix domain-containing protein [Amycolatopsis sp.]
MLAEATGWSPSTVRRRLTELCEGGVLYFDVDFDQRSSRNCRCGRCCGSPPTRRRWTRPARARPFRRPPRRPPARPASPTRRLPPDGSPPCPVRAVETALVVREVKRAVRTAPAPPSARSPRRRAAARS